MGRVVAGVVLLLIRAFSRAMACSTENVARDIQYGAIQRAAELAKQQSALLVRFRTIGDRAKDPNKPLNQQLSQSDLAEFAQVQQRFQSIELQQLLESNYSRDNLVIRDFFLVAQKDYLGSPAPKEGANDYLPYAFLAVMAVASDDPQIQKDLVTIPAGTGCIMETALHEIEQESLDKLSRLPIAQANKEIKAIQARNGGGKVDRDKLNSADREILDRLQRNAFVPANREKSFITNLESLKLLARSAALKFESGKKDAVDSGGDINAIGNSIAAINLDIRSRMGLNMLDRIAEKYPSDWFKQKERIAPVIDAIKKQDAARVSKKQ
jgi:hypothetical protein